MKIVEVVNLSKSYGSLKAVSGISFSATEGEILAVAGPDGAGKTSLFRSLCGLVSFTADKSTFAGHNVVNEQAQIKPFLGYMPQSFSLYPDLSVEENLGFYGGLFGVTKAEFRTRKERLYSFSGLGPFWNRRAGQLSGGMKQKLALSCNLIHNPKVLVLDEPTTGVDPLSRRQFWEILKTLRQEGSAIIVSTPYMDEVALADQAFFMFGGRKLAEGTPAELAQAYQGRVYRIGVEPTPEMMRRLAALEGIDVRRFGASVHAYTSDNFLPDDLVQLLVRVGITPAHVEPIPPELEDTFIQLMSR